MTSCPRNFKPWILPSVQYVVNCLSSHSHSYTVVYTSLKCLAQERPPLSTRSLCVRSVRWGRGKSLTSTLWRLMEWGSLNRTRPTSSFSRWDQWRDFVAHSSWHHPAIYQSVWHSWPSHSWFSLSAHSPQLHTVRGWKSHLRVSIFADSSLQSLHTVRSCLSHLCSS